VDPLFHICPEDPEPEDPGPFSWMKMDQDPLVDLDQLEKDNTRHQDKIRDTTAVLNLI
jgi:hypothetical protein